MASIPPLSNSWARPCEVSLFRHNIVYRSFIIAVLKSVGLRPAFINGKVRTIATVVDEINNWGFQIIVNRKANSNWGRRQSQLPPGTLMSIRARRGGHSAMPPFLWPCNKVLKLNFQSVFSQTNDGCSLLSLILAKLLLLDFNCENIFALFIVTALTTCPFSIKRCAKMSVFYVKTAQVCWRLGA